METALNIEYLGIRINHISEGRVTSFCLFQLGHTVKLQTPFTRVDGLHHISRPTGIIDNERFPMLSFCPTCVSPSSSRTVGKGILVLHCCSQPLEGPLDIRQSLSPRGSSYEEGDDDRLIAHRVGSSLRGQRWELTMAPTTPPHSHKLPQSWTPPHTGRPITC